MDPPYRPLADPSGSRIEPEMWPISKRVLNADGNRFDPEMGGHGRPVPPGMFTFMRKHPVGVGAGTFVLVAGLAWLAIGFFGIHTLFIDDVVDEAGPVFDLRPVDAADVPAPEPAPSTQPPADGSGSSPAAVEATPTAPAPTDAPTDVSTTGPPPANAVAAAETQVAPEIVTEYLGTFRSDAHPTSGEAVVLGNGTGQRFLRFENFATDNGPDLNVYLVDSSTGDVSNYVDLGDLTGNIGDQNYEIPPDVDLTVYDEVVIWCVRFGVGFGDARLTPA